MLKLKTGFALLFFSLCFSLLVGCEGSSSPDLTDKTKVTGNVTDTTGAPIAQALVFPEPAGETGGPIPEIAKFTDEQGHFTWYVPVGTYNFIIQKQGFLLKRVPVTATESKKTVHLRIILYRE
ncbi:carboxypeptidase-like regulatory domain-containing protein [Thermoactinomyces mirandus]|uniref:Carboxypeptidase regulatory-like domain-containing protein n=1 Tax=Thermoactinomyces mirandus TaxID=2756294 RepID=A0A7W2ATR6_9BACL|nr:carboxypeptidase-like regulatory domain-containing protein [Thermoactinomyces mirandus]MBA4603816.1 carboxypeptidase regulatory-like domain-containing protein [Thermoactinomyces mirandus]